MHLLSGGRLRLRRSLYAPQAARDELMEVPVLCALFKHAQGNVLFDTGCHPGVAEDAAARWGGLVKVMSPVFAAGDTVIHQLPSAGLVPGDIDVVVCSHLHPDHCGCNGFFPRATLICHAAELAAARQPDARQRYGYLREDWDTGAKIEAVDGQRDLFGDGRLTLLPAPGHTPCMLIARAALDREGVFLLASDAAPLAEVLAQRQAPRNSWDAPLALAALEEIARQQSAGAQVIYGHDEAQWRSIRKGAAFFD